MDCNFVAKRITELRIKKGISEQKMSFELNHSGNYIHLISSGKMVPSLKEFFSICEFLDVPPSLFFEENIEEPELVYRGLKALRNIPEDDLNNWVKLLEKFAKCQ